MTLRIEDYGLIGDTHTAALVGRDGSIDWLCLPRFDSAACFAHLLGDRGPRLSGASHRAPSPKPGEGDPLLATQPALRRRLASCSRASGELAEGTVRLTECMPIRETSSPDRAAHRVHERLGRDARWTSRSASSYGSVVPWVRHIDGPLVAIAGPDGLALWTPVAASMARTCDGGATSASARASSVPFVLSLLPPPRRGAPAPSTPPYAVEQTDELLAGLGRPRQLRAATDWQDAGRPVPHHAEGAHLPADRRHHRRPDDLAARDPRRRAATGTTATRWLRDATLTLSSLMAAGYRDEAAAWRDWLLRAVAGEPSKLQIMYGAAGERNLKEVRARRGCPATKPPRPVRVGNAAADQYQLDVYGEVISALHEARRLGIPSSEPAWDLELAILDFLESGWKQPDDGIWEVRGPRRHFTHSKMHGLAWRSTAPCATSRSSTSKARSTSGGSSGPRSTPRCCEKGYDAERKTFTQYYGSKELDASVLMAPLVGFLAADRRTDRRDCERRSSASSHRTAS